MHTDHVPIARALLTRVMRRQQQVTARILVAKSKGSSPQIIARLTNTFVDREPLSAVESKWMQYAKGVNMDILTGWLCGVQKAMRS